VKRLFIISLLSLSVGLSQQLIPQITETYKNGNIKSITYHKNTRDKIEKIKDVKYYENRQKEEQRTYKDGKEDGLHTEWYENGQKMVEITFKDGIIFEAIGRWNKDGSVREKPFRFELYYQLLEISGNRH
jgi:antitoxin component YwqK of YwqJK toxin-antitoxin module